MKVINGGFTYVNPQIVGKTLSNVLNLDINSLYPYCMYEKDLPWGQPIYFKDKYKQNNIYNLYIQRFSCIFNIKPNHIPTIQVKQSKYGFCETEYLKSSEGESVTLALTNIDLELFFKHYDIEEESLKYEDGFMFKSSKCLFTDYIDKWMSRKVQAGVDKNEGMKQSAKLMLNSLYGKFGTALERKSKSPYLEDDIVRYKLEDSKDVEGLYIPLASFVTAHARSVTISTAQAITDYSLKKYKKDLYYYSDTDSIKTGLTEEEVREFCRIDDLKLGYWKNEGIAKKAKFIKPKCYIEQINNKLQITCAGLPENCYKEVNWKNFNFGFKTENKLKPKHVKGGILLTPSPFEIKKNEYKRRKKK